MIWMSEWLLSVIYTMLQKINIISNIFRQKKIILKKYWKWSDLNTMKGFISLLTHVFNLYSTTRCCFWRPFFFDSFFSFLDSKMGIKYDVTSFHPLSVWKVKYQLTAACSTHTSVIEGKVAHWIIRGCTVSRHGSCHWTVVYVTRCLLWWATKLFVLLH